MSLRVIDPAEYNTIAIVDQLIIQAVEQKASDIHLESTESVLRIRFRIDGVLIDKQAIASSVASQVIARLKVMALLDSAERRMPQDGKFIITVEEKSIDIRMSTFPTLHGEKVVLRILDRTVTMIHMNALGLSEGMMDSFKQLLLQESGFILITGPTGSGKTTTLYAALSFLNLPSKNIVTLEDPIEYELDNITQSQIHPQVGFTFACGIRSILRQDPDVLMVGEIRDSETAKTAIQASLTGHFVLSTIHTVDAPSVIIRLIDMGIEPFLISASLTGVISQRLIRVLCTDCRYQDEMRQEERSLLQKHGYSLSIIFRPKGCIVCHNSGYKGRIALFEFLVISPNLRQLILCNSSSALLYEQAFKDGMKPLFHDMYEKLKNGLISFEELLRIGLISFENI